MDSEYGEIWIKQNVDLFNVFLFDLSFIDLLSAGSDVIVEENLEIGGENDIIFHIDQRFVYFNKKKYFDNRDSVYRKKQDP